MARHRAGLGMRYVALAAVVGLSASACSETIPLNGTSALFTTPSAATSGVVAGPTDDGSRASNRDVVTFTLANGRFKFTSESGELTGAYSGVVTVPEPGRSTVSMTLQVTAGSNALAGATGTLVGNGGGAFVTGGNFVLSLAGVVNTSAEPSGSKFHATVVGTATLPLTCSAANHRVSRLRGEATIATLGRSGMELDSEILETGCF